MMVDNYTYDYFISYRRACGGYKYASKVYEYLRKYNKKVFLDKENLVMGKYQQQLIEAIENSRNFILILNEESWRESGKIDSYYEEIIRMVKEKRDILPIEFAYGTLKTIPKILTDELKKFGCRLSDYEKITVYHNPYYNFEDELCHKLNIKYQQPELTPQTTQQFPISIPDGLLPRDTEVESLYQGITNNRFFNLVGVGGSGKTSLTYLLMQKHQARFNEIAFVTVNNNIKDDIVASINGTLNLVQNDDSHKFEKIIIYLSGNYNSSKPNLLVLDINETSDYEANKQCAKELKNKLTNWKVLIISREQFRGFETLNLNDIEDIEFLKKLFLAKAGNAKYQHFTQFDELFKTLCFSPILVEQLGLYLHELPTLSLDDIKAIFFDKNFKEEELENRNDTITTFLNKLIDYKNFKDNEKELLRHFILWQTHYIEYNVIKKLLKEVFVSNEDFINAIVNLSKRAILTTDGKESYKLHGLLAESLRKQIDITNQDYSTYLKNINDIINDQCINFISYADCIGNSLSKYDIITETNKLYQIAIKFHQMWKTDYAYNLYNKCLLQLKDSPRKDNIAIIFNVLASLQTDQLFDYESDEKNYKKAISIGIDITRNSTNPKFLDNLASSYGNLANLQYEWLNDIKSANINYKKAINIQEKITKISNGNLEYLHKLAVYYDNHAVLQFIGFNDRKSASKYFKKAIKIHNKIAEMSDTIESLSGLASAYMNYANFESDNLQDYESADKHYNMAIKIREKIADNSQNIDYQLNLAILYHSIALFQINQLQNPKLAEQNFIKEIKIRENLSTLHHRFVVELIDSKIKFASFYFNNHQYKEAKSIITAIKPTFDEFVLKEPNNIWVKKTRILFSILEGELNGTARTLCSIYPNKTTSIDTPDDK